jgi:hypothetical protein
MFEESAMKRLAIAVALSAQFVLPVYAQEPPADAAAPPAASAAPQQQQQPEPATAQSSSPAPATSQTTPAQPGQAATAPPMSPEMQAMMDAWQKASTPGPQHQQLATHFAGNWTTKQTVWMDPSAPPIIETGTSVNTAEFGGRHVRSKFSSRFMGQPFTGEALTSYDNTSGKYANVWIDSMGTGQYVSSGGYDPATKTYTFTGQMADPLKPGATTTVREVVRIVDADHHVMEMYETRDGKENKTMVIEYTLSGP